MFVQYKSTRRQPLSLAWLSTKFGRKGKPLALLCPKVTELTFHHLAETTAFKGEFHFLHIKPYNKDIYNHIQCLAALL